MKLDDFDKIIVGGREISKIMGSNKVLFEKVSWEFPIVVDFRQTTAHHWRNQWGSGNSLQTALFLNEVVPEFEKLIDKYPNLNFTLEWHKTTWPIWRSMRIVGGNQDGTFSPSEMSRGTIVTQVLKLTNLQTSSYFAMETPNQSSAELVNLIKSTTTYLNLKIEPA